MLITKLTNWCALTTITVSLIACQNTSEQATTQSVNHVPLTVERIYKDDEFNSQWLGQIRWLADGSGYTAIEKSAKTKKLARMTLKKQKVLVKILFSMSQIP